jgi:hypothetical protein
MTDAHCKDCLKLTDEKPPFCVWLKAEIPVGLADDPTCEGFVEKGLRTSKAGKGSSHKAESIKGDGKRVGGLEPPVAKPPKAKACPKTSLIQTALKLKAFGGSVIMERICCGKPGCHCQSGSLHGPYPYLHYYSDGKVKRRYLSKTVSGLLNHSAQELEKMLHETEAALGQGGVSHD